jgi:uncharacterized membrane protein YdjX (TVP38/TMEM64 family)
MKGFFAEHKSDIKKIIYLIIALIVIALVTAVVLTLLDVVYFDQGIKLNVELFSTYSKSFVGVLYYLLLQCIVTVLLCALPGTSLTFIMLSTVVFDKPYIAFLVSFTGVGLSSTLMYIVGRFGGYKLCAKLIGEEDMANATKLMREKGTIYFPIMMTFPIFPDDALVMIAGVSKLKLAWFLPSVILGRGIGIATTVFGLAIVPFESFTGLYDWFLLITACAFWVILIFILANKLNAYLEKRRKNKE